MPKNLFLFTDGTGNAGGKSRNTNVYRLFRAIDRHHEEVEQRAFYDDGVGTADNVLARAIGGAFGAGLSRNIRELYQWLVVHFDHEVDDPEQQDRIFVFGFSRGAFTARCLAGLVNRCGILKKSVWEGLPASERESRLRKIVWAYRATSERRFEKWRGSAGDFTRTRVHFVGVWDTVDAVGMPLDELRPIMDVLFRVVRGRRAYGFHDRELSGVEHARHAIAIDDERRTFHPNVWHRNPSAKAKRGSSEGSSRPTDAANIRQVWFAGAHSNVGGGYPKDQMAYVALDWMMGELEGLAAIDGTPVHFVDGSREEVQGEADAMGRMYDPRTGLAVYYRYSPRRLGWFYKGTDDFWMRCFAWWRKRAALPSRGIEIHASVFERVVAAPQGYAPLFLPDGTDPEFKLTAAYSEGTGPYSRSVKEGRVADLPLVLTEAARKVRRAAHPRVVARQVSYAAFVLATVYTLWKGLRAKAPVVEDMDTAGEVVLAGVTRGELAGFLKGLLPDLFSGLVDAAFAHPGSAVLYVAALVVCGGLGLGLKRSIGRVARGVYEDELRSWGARSSASSSS